MSSPATISRTFINMSASSPIDLTNSPVSVRDEVVIISDNEDEPSHSCNSSTLGFDNQNIFNSSTSRHSSNNNQVSTISSSNYNLRSGLTGLDTNSSNGGGPIRNTSTRSNRNRPVRGLVMLNVTVSTQPNNHRNRQHNTSAFHPYSIFMPDDIPRIPSFFEPNTNINSNNIQTPPTSSSSRQRANNSPKPVTPTTPAAKAGHARDLEDSHILICAGCDGLLHEKLWALSNCGHVVCGSCVDKYLDKKKFFCPSCNKSTRTSTLLQLYV